MTISFSDNKQPGRAVSPVSTSRMRQHFYVMTSLYSTSPASTASTSLGYTLYKLGHVYYEGTAAGTRCSGGWPGVAPGGNVGI